MNDLSRVAPGAARELRYEAPGDLLSTTSEAIRERLACQLEEAAAAPVALFHLDLPRTRMIDSVGLNLLVWLIKETGARGGKLRIRVYDPNVLRTLEFTRLDQHAEIVRAGS